MTDQQTRWGRVRPHTIGDSNPPLITEHLPSCIRTPDWPGAWWGTWGNLKAADWKWAQIDGFRVPIEYDHLDNNCIDGEGWTHWLGGPPPTETGEVEYLSLMAADWVTTHDPIWLPRVRYQYRYRAPKSLDELSSDELRALAEKKDRAELEELKPWNDLLNDAIRLAEEHSTLHALRRLKEGAWKILETPS